MGITGQDGSYLAELLLAKGYEVHGSIRRASTFNTERIDHLYTDPHVNRVRLFLHYGDIADSTNPIKLLSHSTGRSLSPRRTGPRAGELRHSRIHRRRDGVEHRRILEAIRETGVPAESVTSKQLGDAQQSTRNPSARDDSVSPAQPIRGS